MLSFNSETFMGPSNEPKESFHRKYDNAAGSRAGRQDRSDSHGVSPAQEGSRWSVPLGAGARTWTSDGRWGREGKQTYWRFPEIYDSNSPAPPEEGARGQSKWHSTSCWWILTQGEEMWSRTAGVDWNVQTLILEACAFAGLWDFAWTHLELPIALRFVGTFWFCNK